MKYKKTDIWKIASIILIITILGLSIILYTESKDTTINLNGIEISSKNYNAITSPLPNGNFVLCSIEQNKCGLNNKQKLK